MKIRPYELTIIAIAVAVSTWIVVASYLGAVMRPIPDIQRDAREDDHGHCKQDREDLAAMCERLATALRDVRAHMPGRAKRMIAVADEALAVYDATKGEGK